MPVSTCLCAMLNNASGKCPVMSSTLLFFSTRCFWDFNVRAPVSACIEENTPYPNTCSHSIVFSILRALRGLYDDCYVNHRRSPARFCARSCAGVCTCVPAPLRTRSRGVPLHACACVCVCKCARVYVRVHACAGVHLCARACHTWVCARTRTSLRGIFIWGNL